MAAMKKAALPAARAFAINLLAAYAPALLWQPWDKIGRGGDALMLSVCSPIALLLLGIPSSGSPADGTTIAIVLLAFFLLALLALAVAVHRSMPATLLVGGVLFGVSLAQGMVFSSAVLGIDAIGHCQGTPAPSRMVVAVTSAPSP